MITAYKSIVVLLQIFYYNNARGKLQKLRTMFSAQGCLANTKPVYKSYGNKLFFALYILRFNRILDSWVTVPSF